MGCLAIFRSCLRKEYSDQVIKMLRAVEGEYTRTAFRLNWVTTKALDLLEAEKAVLCVASLVNRNGSHALPSRLMTVSDYSIDHDTGSLRLLLEIGPFVTLSENFVGEFSKWDLNSSEGPPHKFVTIYEDTWPQYTEAGAHESLEAWRRSILFATQSWDFKNTIFLRPLNTNIVGSPKNPTMTIAQEEQLNLDIASFNPHLTDFDLERKQLQVTSRGAIANIAKCPPIDRDGIITISAKFLEPGSCNLEINVQPDPQFSTYIPLGLTISPDLNSDPVGPRVLGESWATCLTQIEESFHKNHEGHLEMLNYLATAFPGDPEVMLRRGQLHLKLGKFSLAKDELRRVLAIRESSRGVTWLLIAALMTGDVKEAESLLTRLNLSEQQLFEQIVENAASVTEETALRFIDAPGISMGEDKAVRLIRALGYAVTSHEGARKVMAALADVGELQAVNYALECLLKNPDWRGLRRDYVELAHKIGRVDGVQEQAEILLRYEGEEPSEIVDRVDRLGQLVHPVRLLGTLIFNSVAFFAMYTKDATLAGLDQATRAADLALKIGDLATADFSIQQIYANSDPRDTTHKGYLVATEQLAMKVLKIKKLEIGELEKPNSYIDFMLDKLRISTVNKSLVVIGGYAQSEFIEHWKIRLGLKDFQWITSSPTVVAESNSLMEMDHESLIVIVIWHETAQLSSQVANWIEKFDVQMNHAFHSSESILHALMRLLPETESGFPSSTINSCAQAFERAKDEFKYLDFNPNIGEIIKGLDEYPLSRIWARKIWRGLKALNEYAAWRSTQAGSATAIKEWLAQNGLIPAAWLTMKESEALSAQSQFYRARVFPIDRTVDPSGKVFMEPHLKIDSDHPAPRIHFYDASSLEIKKIFVGYIGPHLPTPSGH